MLYDIEISRRSATKHLLELQAEAQAEAEQARQEFKAAYDAPERDSDRYWAACMKEEFKNGYLYGINCAIAVLKGSHLLITKSETEAKSA